MQKILPKKTDFIDFEHLYEQQKILPKNRFHQLKESIVVAENIAKKTDFIDWKSLYEQQKILLKKTDFINW